MPERPLLIFPTPELADRIYLHNGPYSIHIPSTDRQRERLTPQFTQLQSTFDSRRVEVQQTLTGIDPERVLVIETIGSIDNFANAVKRIPGLEWMSELENDEIPPDEDFYNTSDREKKINGRLYLVMTNQQSLREMLSLWHRYTQDPLFRFEYGLGRFKSLFKCLKDIRYWDVEDRFNNTRVIDVWKKELEYEGTRPIRFETELWYRDSESKRQEVQRTVTSLVNEFGGHVLTQSIIPEIAYHSLLAELPANSIQEIIDHPYTSLTKFDGIMFFRPVGQMAVGKGLRQGERREINLDEITELPNVLEEPIIAVLDGLPLARHVLLSDRLVIDDPDNWAIDYLATDCEHGTGTTSLIIYGDLSNGIHPISRKIYVRPVFKPDPLSPVRDECIPEEEELAIDLIHRAVRRMVEGEEGEPAVAPAVKIINLSIGDPNRQFYYTMSPFARLVDWLSARYNLLFIVSAGNQLEPIDTGISRHRFDTLSHNQKEALLIRNLFNDLHNRKILSPAESINALTVGSSHDDSSGSNPRDSRLNLYDQPFPSPYSSFGLGYRRSVKPDLIFPGGRLLYDATMEHQGHLYLEAVSSFSPPGVQVALPVGWRET